MKYFVSLVILTFLVSSVRLMFRGSSTAINRSPSAVEVGPIPGEDPEPNLNDGKSWPPDVASKDLIDMHVHFACMQEKSGCYVSKEFQDGWKMGIYLSSLGVTKEEIEKEGDQVVIKKLSERIEHSAYIKKAVVLALDGIYDRTTGELDRKRTQVMFSNEFLTRELKKYDNLLYGTSINPFRKSALQDLEQAKKDGAVIVKWIPCIMGFNPAEDDPRLDAFYKKLKELNLPLLSHTGGESTFMWSEDEKCNPSYLRKPLSMGVTVVGAHMASHGSFKDTVTQKEKPGIQIISELMSEFDNFYVDISAVTQINRPNHVKYALPFIEACNEKRKAEAYTPKRSCHVLYGSDWPLTNVEVKGFYLADYRLYWFHLTDFWRTYISMQDSVFDRDVALKKGLGMPDKIFKDTVDFFEKHP